MIDLSFFAQTSIPDGERVSVRTILRAKRILQVCFALKSRLSIHATRSSRASAGKPGNDKAKGNTMRIPTICILRSLRFMSFALLLLAMSALGFAQISISINIAPRELPVYEQPAIPGDGYLWVPGYWAYSDDADGYFWVPGTWVMPPQAGLLWTPGYWGWGDRGYVFNDGYWGPTVGFYGGISYGYGYFGQGYEGGRWQGNQFYYNRSVNNVGGGSIHNVYNTTVINNTTINRVSYNGGNGGGVLGPRE